MSSRATTKVGVFSGLSSYHGQPGNWEQPAGSDAANAAYFLVGRPSSSDAAEHLDGWLFHLTWDVQLLLTDPRSEQNSLAHLLVNLSCMANHSRALVASRRKQSRLQFGPLSLCGIWLVVTLCDAATIYRSGEPHSWSHVLNAIFNFFTPILLGNFDPKHPVIFLLLLGGLMLGELLGRFILWPVVRFIYNLLVLSVLTASIDLIVQGRWVSLTDLLSALNL